MQHDHHVAIICPSCGRPGAVASVAIHHSAELAKQCHVTLISDSFPLSPIPGVRQLLIKPWQFGLLRRFAHVPNEVAFAFAAKRAIARLHAGIAISILLCNGHPVASLAAITLKRKSGIPYALVTHGDIFDRPKGTYDPRLTWLYLRTTPPAYRAADLVVALSPYMANLAMRSGAHRNRVAIIPNGIDLSEIGHVPSRASSTSVGDEQTEILFVGRLAIEKGVDILIEAASLLKSRRIPFRLRIVGSGPQETLLRQLVAGRNLSDVIDFVGPVGRMRLGPLYSSAHVVCVPSRSDPLPTVVLEAMACGLPVVGSNTGGIPYMIRDGVTGLLCRPGDFADLAVKLQQIARSPAIARRLGEAGRLEVEANFTWQKVGMALMKALSCVAAMHHPSTP